jgi:hypothetical protein
LALLAMSALSSEVEIRRLTYQPTGSERRDDLAEACARWRLAAHDYFELVRSCPRDAKLIRTAHDCLCLAFDSLREFGSTRER